MNERENYLAVVRGGDPEWVPNFSDACQYLNPSIWESGEFALFNMYYENLEKEIKDELKCQDVHGVTWVMDDNGPIPEPGNYLFEEIEEWREKYRIPDLSRVDWDAVCKQDFAGIEEGKAVVITLNGVFLQLVNAMGFENGLVALITEEEEVHSFFDAVTTFYETVLVEYIKRLPVDIVSLCDDFASSKSLFISEETYRTMLKPYHKRIFDAVKRADPSVICDFHLCGYVENVIGDLVEIGAQSWNPAQAMNDLSAIKERYGDVLTIIGGWDNIRYASASQTTEEEIRASVRDLFDSLALGGRYVFWSVSMGMNPDALQRYEWADDESRAYGRTFYDK